jgi:pyruvate/2-oxoglutarate dehydrogenase complex dihydrolipoamide dehydrogenase (E3) component
MERVFDVVCIGAGVCGEAVAGELAGTGLSLAMVEERLVGGECPYWGGVPTKAMLRCAEVATEALRARDLAARRLLIELDFARVAARTGRLARGWDDGTAARALEEAGATLVRGHGVLVGPRLVEVDGTRLRARRAVVICCGTAPELPPVRGLADIDPWTSREAVMTNERPSSLTVLGGSAVGVELAQAFRRLGARVTLVEGSSGLLPDEEPEASAALRWHLEAEGMRVLTGAQAVAAEPMRRGVRLSLKGDRQVTAARVLVATERRPRLGGFDLAGAGIGLEDGFVRVDPGTLQAAEGVYAGGDVTGLGKTAPLARHHGQVIGARLRGEDRRADHRAVPRVTFTDPELASVGLTQRGAQQRMGALRVVTVDAAASARGTVHGFRNGLIKLVADPGRGVLVGATVVCPRASELISSLALAVRAELPLALLAETLQPFPTFARVLQGALARAAA